MPSYASSPASRGGDLVGTLRLLAYLAVSFALVVLDHRGGWLSRARAQADVVVQPLWTVAGLPGRAVRSLQDNAGTHSQLVADNERLRNELLVTQARMTRLQAAAVENARLRGLLGAVQRGGLDVQLAPILSIDLDPTRQRLVLDAGANDGVRLGQVVLDAGGLVGQVVDVKPSHSIALLLTDPDHAVPVATTRSGVRLVAYGTGNSTLLSATNIPLSADIRVGDMLVTSGLGQRFPAGFPVGQIVALHPDDSRAFLIGDVRPAAQLDRGRDVLLLRSAPPRPVIAPMEPVDAAQPLEPTPGDGTPVDCAPPGRTPPPGRTTPPDAAPAPETTP